MQLSSDKVNGLDDSNTFRFGSIFDCYSTKQTDQAVKSQTTTDQKLVRKPTRHVLKTKTQGLEILEMM